MALCGRRWAVSSCVLTMGTAALTFRLPFSSAVLSSCRAVLQREAQWGPTQNRQVLVPRVGREGPFGGCLGQLP